MRNDRATRAQTRQWPRAVALPLSVLVGAMMTVQSKINGELGAHLGHGPRAGVLAAIVSFVTGLLVLSLALLVLPSWRRGLRLLGTAVAERRVRRWQLVGGIFGAALVAAQATTVASLGVAVFTVAVVAGQTTSGLAVDHAGLSPSGRAPVNAGRMVGALLAVVAVAVSSGGLLGAGAGGAAVLLALFPLLAGAGTSFQQGVNALVSQASSAWIATWNNFTVGTVALVVAFLVTLLLPGSLEAPPTQWWLYIGGLMGVLFIATAAEAVRTIGVLLFGLCSVAGQVISAVSIDLATDASQVTTATYVGAALTLLGVGVAGWSQLRSRG